MIKFYVFAVLFTFSIALVNFFSISLAIDRNLQDWEIVVEQISTDAGTFKVTIP